MSIKHLCLFFHSLPILMDFLKLQPPFSWKGSGGGGGGGVGVEPLTKFSKGEGLDRTSTFRGGGGDLLMTKKVYNQKYFSLSLLRIQTGKFYQRI